MAIISVIVPVYKAEQYLHRCVNSILAQTFTDFELILVDDGSPDACPAICDEYARMDNRVQVIHQTNGGVSLARNAGIEWTLKKSDSQWISFVDSDDRIHPQMLELLYEAAISYDTKLSLCSVKIISSHESYETPDLKGIRCKAADGLSIYYDDWLRGVVPWNKLYSKELFDDIRYPVGVLHEDEHITYLLMHKAGNVVLLDEELYFYFQNPIGIMRGSFDLRRASIVSAVEKQYRFVRRIKRREFYELSAQRLLVTYFYIYSELRKLDDYKLKRFLLRLKAALLILLHLSYRSLSIKRNEQEYSALLPCTYQLLQIAWRVKHWVLK